MDSNQTYKILNLETQPYQDQNPGTSGLRKKVTHFHQKNYIENFIQCIFNAHSEEEYKNKSLVVGGDGRYYNDKAIQIILKISAANGIRKIILAENGIMSTPAISLLVRNQSNGECFGAVILTASHNPGGEHEDLGIKFNNAAGAPAPEGITSKIFQNSKGIKSIKIIDYQNEFNLSENKKINIEIFGEFEIFIESSTRSYIEKMQELFDFTKLKVLFGRKDFKFAFDAMHGVSGPYAIEIFHKILGVPQEHLNDCNILPDFGGLHPDPNLVYAKKLVKVMDIAKIINNNLDEIPDFGAACDGDADRNMILGKQFFISPSDSLAMITANYKLIPNLNREGGLKGVARSMPTSSAVDRVAEKLGIKFFETPTGWKFFGNLMDAQLINLCGEESFGTGSDHIREKDGLWAVLCWLNILAEKNYGNEGKLINLRDIALDHWKLYGRDYYCRFDYELLPTEEATLVTNHLNQYINSNQVNIKFYFRLNLMELI